MGQGPDELDGVRTKEVSITEAAAWMKEREREREMALSHVISSKPPPQTRISNGSVLLRFVGPTVAQLGLRARVLLCTMPGGN